MVIRIGLAMLQGARHEHVEALYNAALELDVTIDVVPLRSEIILRIQIRWYRITWWRIYYDA